jgi:hypothetical protein
MTETDTNKHVDKASGGSDSGTGEAGLKNNDGRFDWSGPIPPGAPSAISKYPSWDEFLRAHNSLHAQFGETNKRVKELDSQLSEREKAIADLNSKVEKASKSKTLDPEAWTSAMAQYFSKGEVDKSHIQTLSKQTGLPDSEIASFLEYQKAKRDKHFAVIRSKNQQIEPEKLHAWFNSDKCTFSPAVVAGFAELANQGNIDWVDTAWKAYESFVENGGTFVDTLTGVTHGAGTGHMMRGTPIGQESKGFKSRAEYQSALRACNNDKQRMAEVDRKLEATPASVINSPQWLR